MILKIKEFREYEQLTQKQLANKINNVQRNISNWENGSSEPDCETIVKLAKIFNISIDELFGIDTTGELEKFDKGDYEILRLVRNLSSSQKKALLQFLKELNADK